MDQEMDRISEIEQNIKELEEKLAKTKQQLVSFFLTKIFESNVDPKIDLEKLI
jgi:hypothetical protein